MTTIEKINLLAVFFTIIAGGFYVGKLDGRIDGLDPDAVRDAQERANVKIDERTKSALEELRLLPAGTVMAFIGSESKLEAPAGWVRCGELGTPDLGGRYLVGTDNPTEIGVQVGSPDHTHGVQLTSGPESGGRSSREGVDNETGFPNWNHTHPVVGETGATDTRPPSTKVLFFCKL